jgi:hypothetical protein
MSKTYIPATLRVEATASFKGLCAYCRSPQELMNVPYEVDHIVPEKAGGATVSDNLAYACPLCNGVKGSRTQGRDPLTGRIVPLFHPRRQNWFRHFRWSDDNTEIVGRTQSGRATVETLRLNNENLQRLRAIWLAIGSSPPNWHTPLLDRPHGQQNEL